jgi:hypothetical protein
MSIRPVLPSSLLQVAEDSYYDSFTNVYANASLRIGVIKQIYDIENEANTSKSNVEYDVLVFQQDQNKGVIPTVYRGCVTMDSIGGIADFHEYVKSTPTDGKTKSPKADDGSYVLLLCIDGTSSRGVIVGALPHHNRKSTLPNLKGSKHLEGEYNGLRYKINKDGEFTLTFKGKTDKKGKPLDATKSGSQIKMEKDGSVEINDRDIEPDLAAGNDKQAKVSGAAPASTYEKVRIDKTKQSIDIISRKDQNQNAGANYNLTVKTKTTHKTAEWIAAASGKASLSSGGVFDIKAGGAMNMSGASVMIKSDAAVQVQGNSIQLNAQQVSIGQGGTPAVIGTTIVIAIGNLGAPTVGNMVGPFSSTVTIAP